VVVATTSDDGHGSTKPRLTRAESSRKNGRKSGGPRTEAGKARSRMNALKHGMTARSTLLPGEEAAEYEAGRRHLHADCAPRTTLEAIMVDRIARDRWLSDRAQLSAEARRAYNVRHAPVDQALAQTQQVTACRQLLFDNLEERSTCRRAARDGGPEHPAQLEAILESSVLGCDWLLGHLRKLQGYLPGSGIWLNRHGYELVRLMGHHVSDFIRNYDIAFVLLASEVVADETRSLHCARAKAKTESQAAAGLILRAGSVP
jgi:hypothetical protein